MSTRIASLRGILDFIGAESIDLDRQILFDEVIIRPRVDLAQSASDVEVLMAEITTASVVYIASDVAVTVNLNGSSNPDYAINAGGCLLIMGGSITSIHMSEGGTSAAILEVVIAGT